MTRKLVAVMALAFSFIALGCGSVSQSIPAPYPVLVGPVDHIGGAPKPVIADGTAPTIELTNESEASLCGYVPLFSMTLPSTRGMPARIHGSFATIAGTAPLKDYVVRADRLGVGAYELLGGGCWMRSTWWKHEGQLVRVAR